MSQRRLRETAGKILKRVISYSSNYEVYWRVSPWLNRTLRQFNTDRYYAPLDPYKIAWIDPKEITEASRVRRPYHGDRYAFGKVLDGDWDIRDFRPVGEDKRTIYLSEYSLFQAFEDHFNRGYNWEETGHYEKVMSEINKGQTIWHNCNSKEDVLDRYQYLDKLYLKIKEEGLLPQQCVNPELGFLGGRRNEIGVDIARQGDLLFVDGHHRLFISKILGLDKIPVVFLIRHPIWMKKREDAYRENKGPHHPDFAEFSPD